MFPWRSSQNWSQVNSCFAASLCGSCGYSHQPPIAARLCTRIPSTTYMWPWLCEDKHRIKINSVDSSGVDMDFAFSALYDEPVTYTWMNIYCRGGTHAVSYSMGTKRRFLVNNGQSWPTTHLNVMPRLDSLKLPNRFKSLNTRTANFTLLLPSH